MSFAGRVKEVRKSASKMLERPRTIRPTLNGYDPVRAVACAICKVPYGEVGAGTVTTQPDGTTTGRETDARTNEALEPGDDRTAFIDPSVTFAERQAKRANIEWAKGGGSRSPKTHTRVWREGDGVG